MMFCAAQLAFVSGQEGNELKTSCLLQHKIARNRPFQLSDQEADTGAHTEYLRSALVMVKELASKGERDALELIRDFIDDLKKSAINSHQEDQREVRRAKELIQMCADVTKSTLNGDVKGLEATMIGSRQKHDACRTSEAGCQKNEDTFCAAWDSYRKTNVPNQCAGVDFKNDMATDVPAIKAAMQQCLRDLQPFYSSHAECWKFGECVDEIAPFCDTNQTKFERDFCAYSMRLSRTCQDQTDCRKRHISFRNATHTDVQANEAARKADYRTSQQVLCYFKVFEANNTDKSAILRGCEKLAVNTSQLNIKYPAIPAAEVCVVENNQPCDADWVSAEYDAKDWKQHVTMRTCDPCTPTPPPPCPVWGFGRGCAKPDFVQEYKGFYYAAMTTEPKSRDWLKDCHPNNQIDKKLWCDDNQVSGGG